MCHFELTTVTIIAVILDSVPPVTAVFSVEEAFITFACRV